jgi:hypothetical protein
MMQKHLYGWVLAGACSLFAADLALAQNETAPKASLTFKSTLDQYKSYTDEKVTSWKAANDEVGRIGGWRAYLKEANEPEAVQPMEKKPSPQSPAPTTTAPAKSSNPHAGHGHKQ